MRSHLSYVLHCACQSPFLPRPTGCLRSRLGTGVGCRAGRLPAGVPESSEGRPNHHHQHRTRPQAFGRPDGAGVCTAGSGRHQGADRGEPRSRERHPPEHRLRAFARRADLPRGFADPSALPAGNPRYVSTRRAANRPSTTTAPTCQSSRCREAMFTGRFLGDAMPNVSSRTVTGYQWGPDVWARPNGSFVLYYSTPATIPLGFLGKPPAQGCVKTVSGGWTNAECISRATAPSPTGPFVDNSKSAFVCPVDQCPVRIPR
jgi:hypothetical protein